eukprot:3151000-Rhodomonas_salina.6
MSGPVIAAGERRAELTGRGVLITSVYSSFHSWIPSQIAMSDCEQLWIVSPCPSSLNSMPVRHKRKQRHVDSSILVFSVQSTLRPMREDSAPP